MRLTIVTVEGMIRYVLRRTVLSGQTFARQHNLLASHSSPHLVRFNSGRSNALDGTTHEKVVQNREKQQADWTAPIVPYEFVKKLSQQPTKVSTYVIGNRHNSEISQGYLPDRC